LPLARSPFWVNLALALSSSFSVWATNYDYISQAETRLFWALVLLAQGVMGLGYLAAWRFKAPAWGLALFSALVCSLNLFSLSLLNLDDFAALSGLLQALALLAALAASSLLFYSLRQAPKLLGLVLGLILLSSSWEAVMLARRQSYQRALAPGHVTKPQFAQKPNVYLISFDALIPPSLAAKFLQINKTQVHQVLAEKGFRLVPNAFAEFVPTVESINSLLAMDGAYYQTTQHHNRVFASGEAETPLYEIFRANGYRLQFIYQNLRFGHGERSSLDYFGIANQETLCRHINSPYALLGLCLAPYREWLATHLGGLFALESHPYPDFLFQRLATTIRSGQPWLTVSYIFSPGHTAKAYRYHQEDQFQAFRQDWIKTKLPEAADYLEQLTRLIQANDPQGVMVIFGDHGAYVTRGLAEGEAQPQAPYSPAEVYQDRHGVTLALYPPGFCVEEFSRQPFSTLRIGRALVKCLSGQDPLPAAFQADDRHLTPYLYE